MTAPHPTVEGPPPPRDARVESTGDEERRTGLSRSARWWLLGGLGVTLVALAIAATVLLLRLDEYDDAADARQSALTYARQTAINLTSLDYQTLGADIEQVLDGATGAFADDFQARSDNLRDVLTTNEVVSQGQVLEAALVRADERNATAIVVVDATVRNTQNPEGGVTTYRMKLELERQGDRWLTSTLEFVP